MREVQYRDFSWQTHQKNWRCGTPNICQFELTFGCGLRCQHCYTDCYNKPGYIKKELNTLQVKHILNKIYDSGVVWLCFTGGDPLTRQDFLDIYSCAKDKGFLVAIFTNAYSMNKEIAAELKQRPPFVIEITLNAVNKDIYEKISQVKGSFAKAMRGIDLILGSKLPLKIKTQVTQENLKILPEIKSFVESRGLVFRPGIFLHARLNGDLVPCNLRISVREVLSLDGNAPPEDDDCVLQNTSHVTSHTLKKNLFRCAIGSGDAIYIDPYGNLIPCINIRQPKISLLKEDISKARQRLLDWAKRKLLPLDSPCQDCAISSFCFNCPGRALLEKGKLEGVVDWHCRLAYWEARLNC
ncbi:MAG: radical SAM protein [Candidatus Omnitrophota bacterium]